MYLSLMGNVQFTYVPEKSKILRPSSKFPFCAGGRKQMGRGRRGRGRGRGRGSVTSRSNSERKHSHYITRSGRSGQRERWSGRKYNWRDRTAYRTSVIEQQPMLLQMMLSIKMLLITMLSITML